MLTDRVTPFAAAEVDCTARVGWHQALELRNDARQMRRGPPHESAVWNTRLRDTEAPSGRPQDRGCHEQVGNFPAAAAAFALELWHQDSTHGTFITRIAHDTDATGGAGR